MNKKPLDIEGNEIKPNDRVMIVRKGQFGFHTNRFKLGKIFTVTEIRDVFGYIAFFKEYKKYGLEVRQLLIVNGQE